MSPLRFNAWQLLYHLRQIVPSSVAGCWSPDRFARRLGNLHSVVESLERSRLPRILAEGRDPRLVEAGELLAGTVRQVDRAVGLLNAWWSEYHLTQRISVIPVEGREMEMEIEHNDGGAVSA